MFLEDIVDDEVLPSLSLAVDGLAEANRKTASNLELSPADIAQSAATRPSTEMPATDYDPEILEVYGWESSLWRKVRGYLGF